MTSVKNRYGLSRNIKPGTKLRLRKEAGYGCVMCGCAIATYEHIDPEFKDATSHDPDRMAYLCAGCHDRITRKYWSKEMVWEAKKNPYCIRKGKCHDAFHVGKLHPTIWIGPAVCEGVRHVVRVDDEPLLTIAGPEAPGRPYRLSAKFFDDAGGIQLRIRDNEWEAASDSWDIECVGGQIAIHSDQDTVALRILCVPPRGLRIEELRMTYKGIRIQVEHDVLRVGTYGMVSRFRADGGGIADFIRVDSSQPDDLLIQPGRGRIVLEPTEESFPGDYSR